MVMVYYWCQQCNKRYDSSILAGIHAIRNRDHQVHELHHDMTPDQAMEILRT